MDETRHKWVLDPNVELERRARYLEWKQRNLPKLVETQDRLQAGKTWEQIAGEEARRGALRRR